MQCCWWLSSDRLSQKCLDLDLVIGGLIAPIQRSKVRSRAGYSCWYSTTLLRCTQFTTPPLRYETKRASLGTPGRTGLRKRRWILTNDSGYNCCTPAPSITRVEALLYVQWNPVQSRRAVQPTTGNIVPLVDDEYRSILRTSYSLRQTNLNKALPLEACKTHCSKPVRFKADGYSSLQENRRCLNYAFVHETANIFFQKVARCEASGASIWDSRGETVSFYMNVA